MADGLDQLAAERVTFGPFCLSAAERLLTRDGEPVDIGGRSFDLLVVLVEQPGRVLSKRELLKRVWSDVVVEDGSLRFHMAGLRKLLGEGQNGARYIATQIGVGYAFVAPVARCEAVGAMFRPTGRVEVEPHAATRMSGIPARLPHLIGREKDVGLLRDRILDTPLFTIVGPAGVGKTTVAVEVAHQLASRFENQVVFVDFGMLEHPALVAQMIAGAMGVAVQSDDPLAVILGHMRDRRLLLLLDNCEHVVEVASVIVDRIIGGAAGVRVVATSREPLRIRGEHVHRLDALAYPEHVAGLTLDQLLAFPAVQLFCERAAAGDSTLQVDDEAARLIAGMCQRLDGMAFPIELVAVRVATHGLAATARLLGERFSLSWSGRRTALPRQQTLQSMIGWSYDLLSAVQRVVLDRLAIFVGAFSIDAALDVVADGDISADDVAAALDELSSKSLIVPDRSRGAATYRLLEMTRAYARERLHARGAEEHRAVAHRHAAFFLRELDADLAPDEDSMRDTRAIRPQLGNIRGALEWSFGPHGDRRIAILLAAASARMFLNLSSLVECRMWCARAVGELPETQRGAAVELELQAALGISLMFTRGNSQAAGAALSRGLQVAITLDDNWSKLRILGLLHIFHERIGEYSVALSHAQRAIEVAEAIGTAEAIGIAYSLSGISHHLCGNQTRARRELELSLAKSPPSRRSRTIHYGFDHRNRSGIALARTLWLTGQADQAARMAEQTVREAEQLDHPVTYCIALVWSFYVHLWIGDLVKAERALDTFAECAAVNALGPYIAAAEGMRGEVAIQRGDADDALSALEESLARLRAAQYELLTTCFSYSLVRGLLLDGRVLEARELLDATIACCDSNGERFAMAELLRLQAEIVRTTDDDENSAVAILGEAVRVSHNQGAPAWELRAAMDMAALLARRGQREEALTLLEGVRANFPAIDGSASVRRADALMASLRS